MSDKVKLIIEIPEELYRACKEYADERSEDDALFLELIAIANGTPLDSNSERAEVQAYFDGQAYGWEEGRKALIDELKAEIQKLRLVGYADSHGKREIASKAVMDVLDNIGKGE